MAAKKKRKPAKKFMRERKPTKRKPKTITVAINGNKVVGAIQDIQALLGIG